MNAATGDLRTVEIKAFVPARDMELSLRFYRDLGFEAPWSSDELAYLHAGDCSFLLQKSDVPEHAGNFMMHLLVADVDAWWRQVESQELAERYGVRALPPQDRPWKIRDFVLDDPTGVLWRIGQNIGEPDRQARGNTTMTIARAIAQLRTTDLDGSIRFYVETLGMKLGFRYEDFYAGIDADGQAFHLKQVDEPDPSVVDVREGGHFHLYFDTGDVAALASRFQRKRVRLVADVHDTAWGTCEFAIEDDQGHTLYFGQAL